MSLIIDIATKDNLLQYHYYSDDGFRVRKVGTEEVLDEGWEIYHVGSVPPEYEEVYEKKVVEEEQQEIVEEQKEEIKDKFTKFKNKKSGVKDGN